MELHPQLDEIIDAVLPAVQQFHAARQLAPHAATMDYSSQISGQALVADDNDHHISVAEAITYFESEFRVAARANEIVASAIFYHGVGPFDPAEPAQSEEEAHAIIGLLEHWMGESVMLVISYSISDDGFEYELGGQLIRKPAAVFVN